MPRLALAPALLLLACTSPAAGTDAATDGGSSAESDGAGSIDASGTGATPTTSGGSGTSGGSTSGESGTGGATEASTGVDTTTGGSVAGPRYDEVRQKSAHNSFQRDEALFDQLVYHRIRSLEFDIHVGKTLEPDVAGEWYVYHIDVVDDDASCSTLSRCLEQVAALARVVPEHEVVTVWIDLKDGFDAEHRPEDLDARLQAAFGGRLWTPGELLAGCPGAGSLQEAVSLPGCDWPELAALRGRVVVALTGGDLEEPDGALASYLAGDPATRAAFVAPGLADAAAIADHGEAVIFNLSVDEVALAEPVRAANLVSRVWVLDDEAGWTEAAQAGAHHLATNKINAAVDPWATTAGAAGWPFTCIDGCDAPATEVAAIVAVDVDSGDLWEASDSAVFAHAPAVPGEVTLTAAIATMSSHVEPWAKACVGARVGVAADAPYLAVCRPADDHPPSVQLRAVAGGSTEGIELAGIDGLSAETPAFVRIERAGACVRGFGSADGLAWAKIAEHCFAQTPTHLGLLASSHGAGALRHLFVGVTALPGGPIGAGDLTVVGLGSGAGAVQDGLAP